MDLKQAYEKRRQECLALQREVNKLNKTIDKLREGTYVDDEKADTLSFGMKVASVIVGCAVVIKVLKKLFE